MFDYKMQWYVTHKEVVCGNYWSTMADKFWNGWFGLWCL